MVCEIFKGVNIMLCFLAVFNMFFIKVGSFFARLPWVGGRQDVRNVRGSVVRSSGFRLFIIVSVTDAHVGRMSKVLMYILIHVILIASFLILMFSNLIPPSSIGLSRRLLLIGGVFLSFHIKFLICFVIAFSMDFGIPWAFVRNWVIPPTTICIISFFPSREGWPNSHLIKLCSIFSNIGSQDVACSTSFPIHAPKERIGVPSRAIRIWSPQGVSCSFSFRFCRMLARWVLEPMGSISVFSRLNLAPDALHH